MDVPTNRRVGSKMDNSLHVYGVYCEFGYTVAVVKPTGEIIEEYTCGNHQLESTCVLLDTTDRFCLSLESIHRMCGGSVDETVKRYEDTYWYPVTSTVEQKEDKE